MAAVTKNRWKIGVLHIILKVGHPKIILTKISEQKILMSFSSHDIPKWNKLAEKLSQSYTRHELLTLHEYRGEYPVFGGVCVSNLFSFLCCVICFVCLRPVSCVPNVASVSGFCILDFHQIVRTYFT
jgi:hypothetical protein